ncbi:MAG TPA: transaldolase [Thermomicrobiales bacterium]|nr:transaldolase [Thermomicrobiales bacterium]
MATTTKTPTTNGRTGSNPIKALCDLGQSVWLDDISRTMLTSGALERQIREIGIRGVTSNPTIFEKAIAAGDAYDDAVMDLLRQGKHAGEIFEAVEVEDIRNACDLFRPVYDETDGGDGFVSIEVAPTFARDGEGSLTEARRLWASVDRPNLMVKIPGTAEGVPAIRQALIDGININITLLFSLDNYERVAHAYVAALNARHAAGQPVGRIASVASFFVSRVDTLVDKLLEEKITSAETAAERERLQGLLGKVAIANAKLAYASFQEIFEGPRFAELRRAGAKVQRPLWASTGVKNPAYRDTLYVEELIGPHTVNTMPNATIQAFMDRGSVEMTVTEGLDEARRTMHTLAEVGIDLAAVTAQLEDEGIASFSKSFETLLAGVESKRESLARTAGVSA